MRLIIDQDRIRPLPIHQKVVFIEMLLSVDEDGNTTLSESEISAKTAISRTSVIRAIECLKSSGLIEDKMSEQPSKGRRKRFATICDFDTYVNVQNVRDSVRKKETTEEKRKLFKAPSRDEAEALYREHGYHFDIDRFYNHYSSNGWKVGRVRMCDLNATMRTWEKDFKNTHPEVFAEKKPKSDLEIKYEEAMTDKFPRLMAVAYPLTLQQYEYLKAEAQRRNEIEKFVSTLTRFNGSDLSRVKVAYDVICAAMNYQKI